MWKLLTFFKKKKKSNQDHFDYQGITEIVENHLGKGKKVAECTRSQAPVIEIILAELQDLK